MLYTNLNPQNSYKSQSTVGVCTSICNPGLLWGGERWRQENSQKFTVHFAWCVQQKKQQNKVEGEDGCLRMDPYACCGMCTPNHTHTFVHRNKDYIHPHAGTATLYTHMCVHTIIDCIHTHREYFQIIQTHMDAERERERDLYMHTHRTLTSYTHTYVCTHRLYIYTHTASNTNMCACKHRLCTHTHIHTERAFAIL